MITVRPFFQRKVNIVVLCKRNLFSEDYLGITSFKKKSAQQLESDNGKDLKIKLLNIYDNPNLLVLSHQVKRMCYIAENREDVELFGKVFEKYCKGVSSETIIFQSFRVGPELMRMYYVHNMPVEGLNLILNPVTSGFFNESKSYGILQDLLYNNQMYDEVCKLFNVVKDKQIHGRSFPHINYMLYQAACYKLNTLEAYNDALKTLEEYTEIFKRPNWPVIMYSMIFALENGKPEPALNHPLGNDCVSVNIKLDALIKKGAISEALQYFDTLADKSVIIKSVASNLHNLLETVKNSDLSVTQISNYKEKIHNTSFTNKSIDDLATETMHSLKRNTPSRTKDDTWNEYEEDIGSKKKFRERKEKRNILPQFRAKATGWSSKPSS